MTNFHEKPVPAKPRYVCNSCGFATDIRVIIKDHAAVLGHFGWTDREVSGNPIECDPMLCVLCPPDIDPHPFADHLARKEAIRDRTVDVLMAHTIRAAVMASPGHWAYRNPEGRWFVSCGTGYSDGPGCGWTSEPHCYPTKEEARRAGMAHLAEKIQEARRG